jgi:hypothetical protein
VETAQVTPQNLDQVIRPLGLQTRNGPGGTLLVVKAAVQAPAEAPARAPANAEQLPGVVSHIKVLSDKVEDITTLEDWKRTYIKDGMSDQEKAIAIWKTVVKYRHQSGPPNEDIMNCENVHDPMKTFHVYGYGMCCCASSNVEGLARYIGMPARGRIINAHSVPEVFYDNAWHLLDASLMNYFLKEDGKIASVDEIRHAVRGWFEAHPEHKDLRGNDNKLRAFALNNGWKKGPELLARCAFYDANGINGAGWHGWPSNMQEYDWSDEKCGVYDYGASMGYELNIQLRAGERLTRNWFHKNLIIPGDPNEPAFKSRGPLGVQTKMGDIAPGRLGNGTLEYDVPLANGGFRAVALTAENLVAKSEGGKIAALQLKDEAAPGVLVLRMPTSYIYLTGRAELKTVVGEGGAVVISLSKDHGLAWKEAARITATGEQKVDLKPLVYRLYDYRLKIELSGKGTGVDGLKIVHDVLHSQAPLPALAQGENKISFSTGPQEGTITLEGRMNPDEGKNAPVKHTEYLPELKGLNPVWLRVGDTGTGEAVYTIRTPGEITRLRLNAHYRARDAKDKYEVHASSDGGKTFAKVGEWGGPTAGANNYFIVDGVPAGTKEARVKLLASQRNTTCIFDLRIAADYKEPAGGFRPVKITYIWEENGQEKKDVHVVKQASETYTINCATAPLMKTIVLELE